MKVGSVELDGWCMYPWMKRDNFLP